MQNNIVLIETIESTGTGFMYPCKLGRDLQLQYLIVFTNSHVLYNIGLDQQYNKELTDYKDQISVLFYDNLGNRVGQEDICAIYVYNSGNYMRSEEDIAALLIAVKKSVPIVLQTRVCHFQPQNREKIYLEGYPGVLLNDEICSRIQLEGMEKKIFPTNEKVGIYQITDDYHWYNDNKDRGLLQGLSGSLVYRIQNGQEEILGMAQSVSDIQQGENPFKLMYYIKFSQILRHLREANCIIFSRTTEDTYQIQWIYGSDFPLPWNRKKVTLLLLGGSGAGKSSFAKDFAYHGDQLYSTNDGQTTRTKIIYNFQIENKKGDGEGETYGNQAEVKLLTKKEFMEHMMKKVGQRPALLLAQALFELSDRSIKDPNIFLENVYELLLLTKENIQKDDWWPAKMLADIKAGIHHTLNSRQIIKCYEDIIETLTRYYSIDTVKYLLDEQYMNELQGNGQYIRLKENIPSGDASILVRAIETYHKESSDSMYTRFKIFQREVIPFLLLKKEKDGIREQKVVNRLQTDRLRKKYLDSLLSIEGFFDLGEFPEINEQMKEKCRNLEIFKREVLLGKGGEEIDEEEQENRKEGMKFSLLFCSCMENIYGEIHESIKDFLVREYSQYGIRENKLTLLFDLDNMNEEKRRLLQKCLQVTSKGSLTGIVNYVMLYDMVSDEYAMILKDLGIDTLQLVDTCGLDHVEASDKQELKNRLYETLYYYSGEKQIKLEEISVLYLKKLDSGKPDELRQVLPCVGEVVPAAPLYCVFTGIDIFYRTAREVAALDWNHQGNRQPKAVNYILGDKGRCLLDSAADEDGGKIDRNRYLVMRNNLIPYCGKKELVSKEYSYYKNNTTYIWKLLASIAMKEYSSLEIVDTVLLDAIATDTESDFFRMIQEIKDKPEECQEEEEKRIIQIINAGEELVKCIFSEASLQSDKFRYNTKQADIKSFCNRNEMGYYGTYRHRMDQRFHEAYAIAVEKKGRNLADHISTAQAAIVGALKNMESKYLGSGDDLIRTKKSEEQKNKFRRILEDMYKTEQYEGYNPFGEEYKEKEITSSTRNKVFDIVFNLSKGLENKVILERFTCEFFRCLKEQLAEDNRQKSQNLLKLNPKFTETLAELENSFLDKYRAEGPKGEGDRENDLRRRFYELMKFYFVWD